MAAATTIILAGRSSRLSCSGSSASPPPNRAWGQRARGAAEQRVELRTERLDADDGNQRDEGNEQAVFDHRCAFLVTKHRIEGGDHSMSLDDGGLGEVTSKCSGQLD